MATRIAPRLTAAALIRAQAAGNPDVEVVVVAGSGLDDGRSGEWRVGSDEDEPGAGGDEAIRQVLREPQVDVDDPRGRRLATVAARINNR